MTFRIRSFAASGLVALAALALGTMAPAMAHPNSHPRATNTCHLAESTSSDELVGFYRNGPQGGSEWITLGQFIRAINAGCGGTFSHSFKNLRTGLWTPISSRVQLPSGTTDPWVGPNHLIVVPGRR